MHQKKYFNLEVRCLLVLLGIHIVFFYKLALGGVIFGSDIVLQNYPVRVLTQELWEKLGRIPWWNPYSFSGLPLCGTFASLCFYPLSRFTFLFPPHIGMNLLVVFHSLMGTTALYAFLRTRQFESRSSLFGAIMYGFGGFMSQHLFAGHLDALATIHWLPVILLCWSLYLNSRELAWIFGASIVLGLQILAGYPQYVYLTHLIWLPALIWMERSALWRVIPVALIYLTMGIGLSAIQWLPASNILKESVRGNGLSTDFVGAYAMTLKDILSLFIPHLFGDGISSPYQTTYGWEVTCYLGLIGILVMTQARYHLCSRKWALGLLLLFLALAMGPNLPWLFWLNQNLNPFAAMFRAPGRYLICVSFMAVFLASDGFQNILESPFKKRFAWALVALFATDLYLAHGRYYQTTKLSRFADIDFHPKKDRFFSIDSEIKFQTQNLIHQKYHVFGYDPMIPKYYNEFLNESIHENHLLNQSVFRPKYFPKLLGKANARWIIVDHKLDDNDLKLFGRQGKYFVYEYPNADPRFYFLSGPTKTKPTGANPIQIEDNADEIFVSFEPSKEARDLIIADNAYPGWRAWTGSTELALSRYNGFMKRVKVPEGISHLRLTFIPNGADLGRYITVLSIVIIFAGMFITGARVAPLHGKSPWNHPLKPLRGWKFLQKSRGRSARRSHFGE